MKKRKTMRRLAAAYGKVPDPHYFHGDMAHIRAYSDFRRQQKRDPFLLDDITWNDLGLDEVFLRINPGLSTSGEQYLYYMLRSPALDRETYQNRLDLIHLMERQDALRMLYSAARRSSISNRFRKADGGNACRGAFPPWEKPYAV